MKKVIMMLWLGLIFLLLCGCQEKMEISNITGLSVEPDGENIIVSWTPSEDADCYYVYRRETLGEKYQYWGVTQKNEIKDCTIYEGHSYSYRVYPAVITEDRYIRSDKYLESNYVHLVLRPVITAIERLDNKCIINWQEITGAHQYSVYRRQKGKNDFKFIADVEDLFYVDTSCDENTTYEYAVQTHQVLNDTASKSDVGETASAFCLPKIISVKREDDFTIVITWNGYSENVNYGVYRTEKLGGEFEKIGETEKQIFRDVKADKLISESMILDGEGMIETDADTIKDDVVADYYYMIKVEGESGEDITYYMESQIMQLEQDVETSSLYVVRYADCVESRSVYNVTSEEVITAYELKKDLNYLKNYGYTVITSKELLDYMNKKTPLPKKALMITFDHATRGVYEYAYPLLEEYKMSAVIGVTGEYVDMTGGKDDYCSWDELSTMVNSGYVELAAGSYYMNEKDADGIDQRNGVLKLSVETEKQYIEMLGQDVDMINKKISEITGKQPSIFIYPYSYRDGLSDEILIEEFGYNLLLGDNYVRRSRMNYFIDGAEPNTYLHVLNRRERDYDTALSMYIRAANVHDNP